MDMSEKVIILAGGKGLRLLPLTESRPKPDIYLGGQKRLGEYNIDIAAAAGYYEITLAVEYMAHKIKDHYGEDGSEFAYPYNGQTKRLKIKYAEPTPGDSFIGTADVLRKTDLGDDFDNIIVINGDLLTNFNLNELVEFHKTRGGVATLASYYMPSDRIEKKLGMLTTAEFGRVIKFKEKPEKDEIDSNQINAGIYVFPKDIIKTLQDNPKWHDIGKHVIPELLAKYPKYVFALDMKGYWDDVGTLPTYLDTNLRLIGGIENISINSKKLRAQENTRTEGSDEKVKFGAALVGQGCIIKKGALIENSVLCNDVYVGEGAEIVDSVAFPGTRFNKGIKVRRGIFDRDVEIMSGATIQDNVVIGRKTTIEAGANVYPNVMIGGGQIIKGEIRENIEADS
jgi:NDP-sugar pyrophosphorylase family protein